MKQPVAIALVILAWLLIFGGLFLMSLFLKWQVV